MKRFSVIIVLLILTALTGAAYLLLSVDTFKKSPTVTPTSKGPGEPSPKVKNGLEAIKTYAALQFNTTEDKLKIIDSEKQNWSDICLDIKIKQYDCSKKKLSGYQVIVEANGYKTTYRGTDDGSIIRVVK